MTFVIKQQVLNIANGARNIIAIFLFGIYWIYYLIPLPSWIISSYNLVSLWASGTFLVLGILTIFSFERKKKNIGLFHVAYCSAWVNTLFDFLPNSAFELFDVWGFGFLFFMISVFLVSYNNLYDLGLRKFKGFVWEKIIFVIVSGYIVNVFIRNYANNIYLGIFNISQHSERIESLKNPSFIMLLFVIIIGPFVEELFFRGILQQGLTSRIGTKWSIILTALFFSIWHYDLTFCVSLFISGIYYSWLRAKYNNLWITWIVHMINNLIAMS